MVKESRKLFPIKNVVKFVCVIDQLTERTQKEQYEYTIKLNSMRLQWGGIQS